MAVHYEVSLKAFDKSIKSIFKQNNIPKEILIIFDGEIASDVEECISKYISLYANIKILKMKNNSGLAKALNLGILNSTHSLVARLDPDDEVLSNRFHMQFNEFKVDKNLAVCGSNIIEIYNGEENLIKKPQKNKDIYKSLKYKNPLIHSTVMFNKKDILSVGGYPEIDKCQDYLLWIKLLENNFIFKNISKPLVRTNLDLSMMQRRGLGYFFYEFKVYKYMLKNKIISFYFFYFISMSRFLIRMLPNFIKIYLYRKLR